jgi:hypothetical protein
MKQPEASSEALEALRRVMALASPHLDPEEMKELVERWTTPKRIVAKVIERRAQGTICKTKEGLCLIPEVQLPLGENLYIMQLPAPSGLPWQSWADSHERAEKGWSVEGRTSSWIRQKTQDDGKTASFVHRNDSQSRAVRQRRQNKGGP